MWTSSSSSMVWAQAQQKSTCGRVPELNPAVVIIQTSLTPIDTPPREDPQIFFENLNNWLNELDGYKIVAGDFNCRSTLWFDRINDATVPIIEELVLNNNLTIIISQNVPTFENEFGTSHIDLTMISYDLNKFITDWEIKSDIISSDHKPILFNITSTENIYDRKQHRIINVNILDFTQVNNILKHFVDVEINNPLDATDNIEHSLASFYNYIKINIFKLAKQKITLTDQNGGPINNRFPNERNYLYNEMITAKENYKKTLNEAQINSWVSFVENDLKPNPCGVVYKLATSKFNKKVSFKLNEENNYTNTIEESANYLLRSLLPDPDETTLAQKQRANKKTIVGKRKRRSSPNSDEEEDIEVQYEEESDIPSVIDETECTGCRESYNSTRKGND
ncbi:hypothetical protein ILUMI_00586 [Ignelater luminosus]|uniref:Endonuclease/exonuclease/phosphatase domain-containing protein n=1 Tax=Ignelater luminosus TaxID=2038154 RepID=A0A8K0DLL8_IGNLU|nr:hypothetical protein ILUMI_00586 [Ignelater luminosus]